MSEYQSYDKYVYNEVHYIYIFKSHLATARVLLYCSERMVLLFSNNFLIFIFLHVKKKTKKKKTDNRSKNDDL